MRHIYRLIMADAVPQYLYTLRYDDEYCVPKEEMYDDVLDIQRKPENKEQAEYHYKANGVHCYVPDEEKYHYIQNVPGEEGNLDLFQEDTYEELHDVHTNSKDNKNNNG